MPRDDIIDLFTTIPLWVVVAVRIYNRPTTPGQRSFLAMLLALAVGATLRLSSVEDVLAALTGIKDAAVLPKHLVIMLASTLLLGWVESVVPPREHEPAWRRWVGFKPRMIALSSFGVAAIAAFPLAKPAVIAPDGSRDFASGQYGDVAGTVHLTVYLLSIGSALVPSILLYLTVARRTDDRLLRLCMRLMALGATVGSFYPVYRISFLAYGFTNWTYPLSEEEFHLGGSVIQLVTIAFVIVGSSVRAVDFVLRAIRQRRGLIALRPLWEELVSVLPPDVVVRRLKEVPSAQEERHRIRDLYGRLDQRIVDISDASHELLPWVSKDLHHGALIEARTAGFHGAEARAAREALCLRVARKKAVDGEPYATRRPGTVLSLRNDLLLNSIWLSRVAHHYASPALSDAADRLSGANTPQEVTA
ncbi:MAB_1171c family putative transporter [Streptomyces pseudovenezuelae]|uniref:MAB_1171c family putative transporter n=1 Tax=Streptomyces pseudovenezuelae TaxID=67350 RepID=UPI0036E0B15E